MSDPKKLQDALNSAMADNVGGEFRSLITNLIEAHSKHPPGEPVLPLTEQQSIVVFTSSVKLIWETYLKASDIVAGIAKPPVA